MVVVMLKNIGKKSPPHFYEVFYLLNKENLTLQVVVTAFRHCLALLGRAVFCGMIKSTEEIVNEVADKGKCND